MWRGQFWARGSGIVDSGWRLRVQMVPPVSWPSTASVEVSEDMRLTRLPDELGEVPNFNDVGLVLELAVFVEAAVDAEGVEQLHAVVDDLVDIECLVMDHPLLGDLHALGQVQILPAVVLAVRLAAQEHEEHVHVDHAHDVDVLHVVGVLRRDHLGVKQPNRLEIAHLFL